jgi:hypothetical protein
MVHAHIPQAAAEQQIIAIIANATVVVTGLIKMGRTHVGDDGGAPTGMTSRSSSRVTLRFARITARATLSAML